MISAEDLHLDFIKHRGCGIRAASYEVGPQAWLPEACVWLTTEAGLRKLWIHSFAHCLGAEKLTFTSKLDADNWALVAAQKIIDRALEQLGRVVLPVAPDALEPRSRVWRLTRHALVALGRIKRLRQN
jgi:hypothetical protein